MYFLGYICTLFVFVITLMFPDKILTALVLIIYICIHISLVSSKYAKYFTPFNVMLISLSFLIMLIISLNWSDYIPSYNNTLDYNVTFVSIRFVLAYLLLCLCKREFQKFSIISFCLVLLISLFFIYHNLYTSYFLQAFVFFNELNKFDICLNMNSQTPPGPRFDSGNGTTAPSLANEPKFDPPYDSENGRTVFSNRKSLYENTLYRANYLYYNQNIKLSDYHWTFIKKYLENRPYHFYNLNEISVAVLHGAQIVENKVPCFVFPSGLTIDNICMAYFMIPIDVSPDPNFLAELNKYYPDTYFSREPFIGNFDGTRAHPFVTRQNPGTIIHSVAASRNYSCHYSQDENGWRFRPFATKVIYRGDPFIWNHPSAPFFHKGLVLDTNPTKVYGNRQMPTGGTLSAIIENGLYPFRTSERPWEV